MIRLSGHDDQAAGAGVIYARRRKLQVGFEKMEGIRQVYRRYVRCWATQVASLFPEPFVALTCDDFLTHYEKNSDFI
jgi:hypothetical protein